MADVNISLQGENRGVHICVDIKACNVKDAHQQVLEAQKLFGVKLLEVEESKQFVEAD